MLLLHSIIQPKGFFKKGEGRNTKITIELAQDSQLISIAAENDLIRKIEERAIFYKNLKLGVQPYIVSVGDTIYNLKKFYVVVDNLTFTFDNFVKALDICFKCHTVFNLNFAYESRFLWTFIQKYFYEIDLQNDCVSSDIISLLSDLQ